MNGIQGRMFPGRDGFLFARHPRPSAALTALRLLPEPRRHAKLRARVARVADQGGRISMCAYLTLLAGLCLVLSCSAPAVAQDVFAGTWVVTDAQPAPWVDAASGTQPDIEQAIRHGTFIFKKDSIKGPAPFDCKKVQYTLSEVGPD